MATDLAIAHEDCLDVLFALADILVAHGCDVNLHDVASRLTCNLQDSLGLAGAWTSEEQAGEAFAHTLACETFLYAGEILLAEQTGETLDLLLFGGVIEHFLCLDALIILQVLWLSHVVALRAAWLVAFEELFLELARERVLFGVGYAIVALVLDVA